MGVKQMLDLSGRVALVTGGSRGLGLAMAAALGEMGARLALTARKQDELEQAAAQLRAQGLDVLVRASDVARPEQAEALVEAVLAHYGAIDILVNNAGTSWGAPAEDHPLDAWRKVVDLNLTGTFALTQQVGKRSMIPRHYGRVINIASVAGLKGSQLEAFRAIAYHTSKGGLVHFTRSLAAEWGRHGIAVNAICPGFIPSKMSRGVLAQIEAEVLAGTPLGRLGSDVDLQGLAVLLASEAARHITGQVIAVDGGASVV